MNNEKQNLSHSEKAKAKDEELREWLEERLEKSLYIDEWHRDDLVKLYKKLK
jgi:hypothetical protein